MNRLAILSLVVLIPALAGVDVTFAQQRKSNRTLHDATVVGDTDEINEMLAKGMDINQRNRLGGTPLHTALMNRKMEVARLLIDKGADVNATNNSGETPLALAVKAGDKEIVEQLIAKGADVNKMAGPGENALSLAKKGGQTEIADLLVKHGAKEPVLEELEGELYGGYTRSSSGASAAASPRAAANPAPVAMNLLADPNEIKTRIKTFKGLEKTIKDTADKSSTEVRHWEQTRYDNRTILLRAVEKQFAEELTLAKKIAVEEKAEKTTAAIDELLKVKKERGNTIYRDLAQQRREQKLAEVQASRSTRGGRTRGRTAGGRNAGAQPESYGSNVPDSPYGREDALRRPGQPEQEQLDNETQEEIRMWSQADPMKKDELAKSVHQQLTAEVGSVRILAVEEEAKKTTAALDGLLLARQQRLDIIIKKIEEERLKQQAREAQLQGRTSGRYSTTSPDQQQNQRRTRGRRR